MKLREYQAKAVFARRGIPVPRGETARSAEEAANAPGNRGPWVQQFKFLRLAKNINYEPIIVALKGLQIHFKPGSFLTASQYRTNPATRELFEELIRWGRSAEPLNDEEIEEFLSGAGEGLMQERRGRHVHNPAYIAYCLSNLQASLKHFNDAVGKKILSE